MPSRELLSRFALTTRRSMQRSSARQRPEIHPARKAASTSARCATKGPSLDQSVEADPSCRLITIGHKPHKSSADCGVRNLQGL